jgi:pimeloyl-ACP methyl ester carboxylesterase
MPAARGGRHRSSFAAVIALGMAALLSAPGAAADSPSASRLPTDPKASLAARPGLAWEPFRFTPRGHAEVLAERARLVVPARHARPDGAVIPLNVVRLPALQRTAGRSPVVYLAGGPGGSALAAAQGPRWPIFEAVRQTHDLILLDQRGTGQSAPPPPCPHPASADPMVAQDHGARLVAVQQLAQRCLAHWRGLGLDPAAYNTAESAADLLALQKALQVEALSLWGMSYGTHLALAALKQPGLAIDRLLLMGVEGPDQTLKLPLQADALLARVGQAAGMPDLVERLRARLEAVAREPLRLEEPSPAMVSAFDLQLLVAGMLGRQQTARMIPSVVGALEAGDTAFLGPILARLLGGYATVSLMPLATDVASGATASRLEAVRRQEGQSVLGAALNFPFPQVGTALGLQDLGDPFRADPKTERPTQFVSGDLDGRTPASHVQAIEAGFVQRGHWIVEGSGHDDELWLTSPALKGLIVDFFKGAAPDDRRLGSK